MYWTFFTIVSQKEMKAITDCTLVDEGNGCQSSVDAIVSSSYSEGKKKVAKQYRQVGLCHVSKIVMSLDTGRNTR